MVLFDAQFLNSAHLSQHLLSGEVAIETFLVGYLESIGDQVVIWLSIENDLLIEYYSKHIEVVRKHSDADISLHRHKWSHKSMDEFGRYLLFSENQSHEVIISGLV